MDKRKSKKGLVPVGRPTSYKPEYCQTAIDFLAQGYSVTALAGFIGCARSSVFKWAEENAQFSDALKTGQAKASYFWEQTLRNVATKGEGNATAAIFGVKNRCRDDWSDLAQIDHISTDGSMTPPTRIELVAPQQKDNSTG